MVAIDCYLAVTLLVMRRSRNVRCPVTVGGLFALAAALAMASIAIAGGRQW